MQSEADRAARRLEHAATMTKMAEEIREAEPEMAKRLMAIAETYRRIAEKLMTVSRRQNSN